MPPFTSSPSPPSPPEKRCYAPLTPSPLNPNTYLSQLRRQQEQERKRSSKPPSTLPQKYRDAALAHANASPTQRLLRQKAALAWRSETLRHHLLHTNAREAPQLGGDYYGYRYHHHYPSLDPVSGDCGVSFSASLTGDDGSSKASQRKYAGGRDDWRDDDMLLTIPVPDEDEDEADADCAESDIGMALGTAVPALSPSPSLSPAPASTVDTKRKDGDENGCESGSWRVVGRGGSESSDEGDIEFGVGLGIGVGGGVSLSQPLIGADGSVRGKRRHGKGGGAGITARRVFVVVALFLGLGLVHGLVSAFASDGGGGAVGGRPPPPGR